MAEDHQQRCHIQAPAQLCANNCGFAGDSATQNLCSNCFARSLENQNQNMNQFRLSPSISIAPTCSSSEETHAPVVSSGESHAPAKSRSSTAATRCASCRRRVGITGFGCRCGATFCGTHRHPESHSCGFDFKALGKDQIAIANPRVVADKLTRRI